MLKIGFFGTPELSASVLRGLLENENFSVEFAVTNPDKKFGRAQTLIASPVKQLAESYKIPVFQPEKIRNNTDFLAKIASFGCDYFVVVAYGKILPKELLEIPQKMCLNVHGSILPKYRGASPIQSALLHGEKETGVTIMQMSEGMDEGAMIYVSKIAIASDETAATLFEKFAEISPNALIDGILWLESGKYSPIEQDHAAATYCSKISKEDGKIDWNRSAREIFQKYQAYSPWPGIFDEYHGKRLLFEEIAFSDEDFSQKSGTVFKTNDGKIAIAANSGAIFPEIIKLEGKKSQSISDFINGNQAFLDFSFNQ